MYDLDYLKENLVISYTESEEENAEGEWAFVTRVQVSLPVDKLIRNEIIKSETNY